MLLEFERPVVCPLRSLAIGSKLDADPMAKRCRLAFQGRVFHLFSDPKYRETQLPKLLASLQAPNLQYTLF
ncbi:unnamed protein product [Protopolystoma xenopodis]|uniref:Selenocysteine-specific elongation factor 3rd domain-containing protein n=1 Tax=Protopolystoma xenopodis TaxID=117903 RepID=A0A448XHS9_9PLAT|nr:unnamed protein product [Protopolystoma xenopodis]